MLRKRLYLLAIVVVGIGAVHAWSQPVPSADNNQHPTQPAQTQKAVPQKPPAASQAAPAPQTSSPNQEQKQSGISRIFWFVVGWIGCWLGKWINDPVAIFTAIIAGVTIGIFRGDRADAKRELRAYVFTSSIVPMVKNGKTVCEFVMKNNGVTPAYEVKSDVVVWVDTHPKRSKRHPEFEKDNPICIGPRDEITMTYELDVSPDEEKQIRAETMAIRAIARINYVDTFGDPWFTNAKFHMNGSRFAGKDDRRMSIDDYQAK